MSHSRQRRAAISFSSVALGAVFKAETEIALLAMPFIIFKPAPTAAAKMFDQRTVSRRLALKRCCKAAGRTEDLYRHVVTFFLSGTHFRRVEIVRVTGVIRDQAVGFTRGQTRTAANDLLIQADRFGRTQNSNQVDVGASNPVVSTETFTR